MSTAIPRRKILTAGLLAPLIVATRSARADVIEQPPASPAFPAVPPTATIGIVAGQIARVSLFHHLDQAVNPCGYGISLFSMAGDLLASAKGQILPGQGAFADFPLAENAPKGERIQFHPHVQIPSGHPVGANVEIFDAQTGVSTLIIVPCGVEDPEMTMGAVGVAAGQLVRV